jgi:hypothetical protein
VSSTEQCDNGNSAASPPVNGVACVPTYNNSCTWCSNTCTLNTVARTQWCGDGVVQTSQGEECETDQDCLQGALHGVRKCNTATCKWTTGTCDPVPLNLVVTDDTNSKTGFNLAGFTNLQTQITGTGASASVTLGRVPISTGSGADGSITLNSGIKQIDTDILAAGRTCPDGVNYTVTSLANSSVTLSSPPAGCITVNDKVMLINLQGDGSTSVNVGNYEILDVQSISGNSVNFTTPKTKYYGNSASSDSLTGSGAWQTLASTPGAIGQYAPRAINNGDGYIYALQGQGTTASTGFYRYNIAANTWTTLAPIPTAPGYGAHMIRYGTEDAIYVTTGGSTYYRFYRYNISTNTWTQLTNTPAPSSSGGGLLRTDADNNIYFMPSGGWSTFYRYNISTNNWTTLAGLPFQEGNVAMIRRGSDDLIYALFNNLLYTYSISSNVWTQKVDLVRLIAGSGNDNMLRNGNDDEIYIFLSGGYIARYQISTNLYTTFSNSPYGWASSNDFSAVRLGNNIYIVQGGGALYFEVWPIPGGPISALTNVPGVVNAGGGGVSDGSFLYVLQGSGGTGTGFWKYGTPSQKVMLQRVPQYSNVTLNSGSILTASPWNGTKGGVVAFYASGNVLMSSNYILADSKGYRSFGGTSESILSTTSGTGSASPGAITWWDPYCGFNGWGNGGGGYGTGAAFPNGGAYGDVNLSKLYFGSAGAGGATSGGGILYMNVNNLAMNPGSTIGSSGGGDGSTASGGSAGGSVYIQGNSISLSGSTINAIGGIGGVFMGWDGCSELISGNGGSGRIVLKSNSISGVTNGTNVRPAASLQSITTNYYSSGTFTSAPIMIDNTVSSYGAVTFSTTLAAGDQNIALQMRSANNFLMTGATTWCTVVSGSTPSCLRNGDNFVQYMVNFSNGSNTTLTPSFNSLTINYNGYSSTAVVYGPANLTRDYFGLFDVWHIYNYLLSILFVVKGLVGLV